MDERRKWAVLAALLAVLGGGVAVVALAGGGSGDERLIVERATVPDSGQPELLVSVEPSKNTPDTARNGRSVGLVCRDTRGRQVLSERVEWPFIEEPGYPRPHAHQPATARQLERIDSCRLTGTTGSFSGRMRLRG